MINIREFFGLQYYTSKLDQFLNKLRLRLEKPSKQQLKEINKYKRIHACRDGVEQGQTLNNHHGKWWDSF